MEDLDQTAMRTAVEAVRDAVGRSGVEAFDEVTIKLGRLDGADERSDGGWGFNAEVLSGGEVVAALRGQL